MRTNYSLERILQEWESGQDALTSDQRLVQMYRAQRLRNFVFGVNTQAIDGTLGGTQRFQGIAKNNAPSFAHDLVITDVVASDGLAHGGNNPFFGAQINVYGTPGAYLEDFYGAGQLLPNYFLTDTCPDSAGTGGLTDVDVPVKAMEFVPRLLKAGQVLQLLYSMDPFSAFVNPLAQSIQPCVVFSTVFALCQNEMYACPSGDIIKACEAFVKYQRREYFIMDLTFPAADRPFPLPVGSTSNGGTRKYRTEPNARPLLIYGIGSNISGAQIQIRDDTKQHDFTAMYKATPGAFIEGDGSLFIGPGLQQPNLLPIWGIAPSASDQQIGCAFKWLPTPHFLEPGAELVVTLQNGLRDNEQAMSVNGSQAPYHIAFACTTL